jgi:hypothetical protein
MWHKNGRAFVPYFSLAATILPTIIDAVQKRKDYKHFVSN